MGWHATAYLLADEGALLDGYTHRQALVLIRLAEHVNEYKLDLGGEPNPDYGWAWPSLGLLARSAPRTGRDTVREGLALAVERGLIESGGVRYRNATRYRFPGLILDPSPIEETGETATRLVLSATRFPLGDTRSEVEVKLDDNCEVTVEDRDRVEGEGYGVTEGNVRAIFRSWSRILHDGQRLRLTAKRRKAIEWALRRRRGTVEQIGEAFSNIAHALPGRERQRCTDLPHILHADRIADAIAGDIDPAAWTLSPFPGGEY